MSATPRTSIRRPLLAGVGLAALLALSACGNSDPWAMAPAPRRRHQPVR